MELSAIHLTATQTPRITLIADNILDTYCRVVVYQNQSGITLHCKLCTKNKCVQVYSSLDAQRTSNTWVHLSLVAKGSKQAIPWYWHEKKNSSFPTTSNTSNNLLRQTKQYCERDRAKGDQQVGFELSTYVYLEQRLKPLAHWGTRTPGARTQL